MARASEDLTFALHELLRLQINEVKRSGKTIRGSVQFQTNDVSSALAGNWIVQFAHVVRNADYRPLPRTSSESELKKVHVFENAVFPFGSPWKSVLRPDVWCTKQNAVNRNGYMPLTVHGRCQPLEHVVCVMRWLDLSSSTLERPVYTLTYNTTPVVANSEGLWERELNVYAFEQLMRAQFYQLLQANPTKTRLEMYEYIMVYFYTVDPSYMLGDENSTPRILRSSNTIVFVGCSFELNTNTEQDFVHAQKTFEPVDYAWNAESPLFSQLRSHPIEMIHVDPREKSQEEVENWLKQPSVDQHTGELPSAFVVGSGSVSGTPYEFQGIGAIANKGFLCSFFVELCLCYCTFVCAVRIR